MIPVLAATSGGAREGSGLFARLQRKQAPAHGTDGCDPKIFAAQIDEYLTRMREDRQAFDSEDLDPIEALAVEAVGAAEAEVGPLETVASADHVPQIEEFIEHVPDEPANQLEPLALAPVEEEPGIVDQPAAEVLEEIAVAESAPQTVMIEPIPEAPPVEAAPVLAQAQAEMDWEEIVIEEHDDTHHRVDVEDDFAVELSSDAVDLQAFVDELKATYADLFPVSEIAPLTPEVRQILARADEPEEPVEPIAPPARLTLAHELPFLASWPSLEGIAAEDAPPFEFDDVVAEFVEALGESEPENPRAGSADSELWMPLASAPALAWPRLESTCSKRPNQDEWGFYDPDKCGLSAVVAKLDQVTR
jgi:hypothetical protein